MYAQLQLNNRIGKQDVATSSCIGFPKVKQITKQRKVHGKRFCMQFLHNLNIGVVDDHIKRTNRIGRFTLVHFVEFLLDTFMKASQTFMSSVTLKDVKTVIATCLNYGVAVHRHRLFLMSTGAEEERTV